MPNQINRDIYVLSHKVKDPIDYVRLTNDIPIVFTFRDYDIPSGSVAQVYVQKPSGKAVYDTAAISENVVTVTVTDQMFSELGMSDMQIKITGLRPGEKLYEELLMDTEQDKMRKTAHNKIFIAPPMQIDLADFYNGLQALLVAAHHNDDAVVECLQHMVPSYHPNRRVRADHTVVAMSGNTGIFSREELEQQMKDHPSEQGAKED